MTKDEFITIILKCRAGDKNAIGRIYNEYFGKMCTAAFRIIKNADAAYDIASAVILKLLECECDIIEAHNPIGYMFRMVLNQALNYEAKHYREVTVREVWDAKSANVPDMLWLEDILTVLTEKERELFVLHIIWDMTLKQAAKQLGITYDTAKSRYKVIRFKIAAVYKK